MAVNRTAVADVKPARQCNEKEDALARCVALTTFTLGQCYIEAGYKDQGKENGNKVHTVLKRPHVQQRVDHYRQMAAAKLDIRAERVMAEMAAIAFVDPIDVFNVDGEGRLTVKSLEEVPPWARRAIASIKEKTSIIGGGGDDDPIETHEIEVRFHPKILALNSIAKIKNMFEEHQKSSAPRVEFDMRFTK